MDSRYWVWAMVLMICAILTQVFLVMSPQNEALKLFAILFRTFLVVSVVGFVLLTIWRNR